MVNKFDGFPIELLKFLDSIQRNNNRKWFEKHKQEYEDFVRGPALRLIENMVEPMSKISPHFRVEAKKMGGSLMRIYRDTRFAKDKSPYKTNLGIHFRHAKGKDVHAPGYYFHVDTEQVFVGAGIWHPDSQAITKIRKRIDTKRKDWIKIVSSKSFTKVFDQSGETLKRPPRGYDAEHPLIDDLKRKDHIGITELDHGVVTSKNLVKEIAKRFTAANDYMKFLCDALKVKF